MAVDMLKEIELKDIRENPNALRQVNREGDGYLGLVDSIRKNGVMSPILVREMVDPITKDNFYSLVDGLHRFTAARDAGRTSIPAHVKNMEDGAVLEAQIMANVHKVETRPAEYANQLVRILAQNPLLTSNELAGRLSKSITWLNQRLGLVKLSKEIAILVDDEKINLSNAYALAKLPEEEQANFLERAMTMQPVEFVPTANARAKEIKDATRQGRVTRSDEFVPIAHLRKPSEIKSELENPNSLVFLIRDNKITDPIEAVKFALQWTLQLDPQSVAGQIQRDLERKKTAADEKAKREVEKLAKQQKDASEKASHIQAQLESAKTGG